MLCTETYCPPCTKVYCPHYTNEYFPYSEASQGGGLFGLSPPPLEMRIVSRGVLGPNFTEPTPEKVHEYVLALLYKSVLSTLHKVHSILY